MQRHFLWLRAILRHCSSWRQACRLIRPLAVSYSSISEVLVSARRRWTDCRLSISCDHQANRVSLLKPRMLLTFQAAVLIVWCSTVVYCQTHTEDLNALKSLSTSLFPAPNSAAAPANWNSSIDACGQSDCGTSACNLNGFALFSSQLSACNWAGICCSRWHVTSISLPEPEPAPAFQPLPVLPIELQNLQSLTELSLPQRG